MLYNNVIDSIDMYNMQYKNCTVIKIQSCIKYTYILIINYKNFIGE